jgi:hypothetical protein
MKDGIKMLIAGVVGVSLVTAFGLHSTQLAKLPQPTGQAFSSVLTTAETGKDTS